MPFKYFHHKNSCVIALAKNLADTEAQTLGEKLRELIQMNSNNHFVIEFSHVEHFDSLALGALFSFYHEIKLIGGALTFAAVPPHIKHLLQRSDLDLFVEFAPDIKSAVKINANSSKQTSLFAPLRKQAKRLLTKVKDRIIFTVVLSVSDYFFRFGCRGKINHVDNILRLKEEGFVLAANHVSYLDWLILWRYLQRQHGIKLTFLAKEKLFTHKLWGAIMRSADCIMVSNDGSRIIDPLGHYRIAQTKYLGIFPEGERSRTGELQAGKPGVIKFAQKLNKRIIPVGLNGFYETWPPSQKLPSPYPCEVNFGEAISVSGHPTKTSLTLLMSTIADLSASEKTQQKEASHVA